MFRGIQTLSLQLQSNSFADGNSCPGRECPSKLTARTLPLACPLGDFVAYWHEQAQAGSQIALCVKSGAARLRSTILFMIAPPRRSVRRKSEKINHARQAEDSVD
jgi:hypothetical protein